MLYPSINALRKKVDSRYTLAMLAAKRARDLIDGAPVLLDEDKESPARMVSIAAEELNEDLISYKTAEQVEAEKLAEEEARAAAAEAKAAEGEEAQEAAPAAEEAAPAAAEAEEAAPAEEPAQAE